MDMLQTEFLHLIISNTKLSVTISFFFYTHYMSAYIDKWESLSYLGYKYIARIIISNYHIDA